MMKVTSLKEINKNRIKVTLDNEFSFVLYKGELRLYKIEENQELEEAAYHQIMEEVLPKRAKLRAMNLLKVKPYTYKGMYDKLLSGGYPDEIIKVAMDYVCSYHYIDDNGYAREYIETYMTRKNRSNLLQNLLSKGISKEIALNALDELLGEEGYELEKEQILSYLRKKKYNREDFDYLERQKLLAALYRKGYSIELSKKLLDITSDYL